MATPRSNYYAVASGGGVYAGRSQGLPAYLAGAAVREWVEIPDTSGAGGSAIDAFSGFEVTPSGLLVIPLAGGHLNSADNRVASLDLMADSPGWTVRIAASSSVQADVRHYSDGRPSSRHTYRNLFYVPSLDRVFSVGCAYAYGAGANYASVDALDIGAWAWDAAGTFADVPEGDGSGKIGAAFDGTAIWSNTLRRFNPSTNTWSNPITTRVTGTDAPGPMCYETARQQLFGINGRTGSLVASRTPVAGSEEFAVTINASSALTQFLDDKPWYPGMGYDPENGQFLIYAGQTFDASGNLLTNVPGRVFAVTPNDTNVWDMSLLSMTGTPPGAPPADGSGINGRFRYVPALKGFVLLPQASSNLFFFRVA